MNCLLVKKLILHDNAQLILYIFLYMYNNIFVNIRIKKYNIKDSKYKTSIYNINEIM